MIFGRQPAFWVGLIATILIGVVQTIAGEGVISDVAAGKSIDLVNGTANLLVLLLPLLANVGVLKPLVTPVAAPALPVGSPLTVITPAGQDNRETTVV